MLSVFLFGGMLIIYRARQLRAKHMEFVEIKDYIEPLKDLMKDETIPKEANNLVYSEYGQRQKSYRFEHHLFHLP
jgi:KUP system potassium uptake protein